MDNSNLAIRMKEYYEQVPKTRLMRRVPVAIRLDGKAFHTWTKGFTRPFDEYLGNAMEETLRYLCENISGCIFGYTESDEITLILIDYQTFNTDAWFSYEVQKLCSVAASMATMAFNKSFAKQIEEFKYDNSIGTAPRTITEGMARLDGRYWQSYKAAEQYINYYRAAEQGAMFDARCFNIPKEEVTNLIYWRQLDCQRNSIQSCGQANFSDRELFRKTQNDILDMLINEKDFNWNNLPTRWKRGIAWTREKGIDLDMPLLKGDGRDYLNSLVFVGEE